jgi:hypothetical protein
MCDLSFDASEVSVSQFADATTIHGLTGDLELLGTIVRLQVQTSSLKCGERPRSWYTPEFIRTVPALRLDDGGVTGVDEGDVADVHHRDHPQSKWRGENGLSVVFSGHYSRLRERFGPHLTDGIAGENILVEADREFTESEVAGGIVIVGAAGPIELEAVQHAPPCVEFSKFCAGYASDQRADAVIADTLQFLNLGMRGFYATLAEGSSSSVNIALGDSVYRRTRSPEVESTVS